jgi:hypothetical protein
MIQYARLTESARHAFASGCTASANGSQIADKYCAGGPHLAVASCSRSTKKFTFAVISHRLNSPVPHDPTRHMSAPTHSSQFWAGNCRSSSRKRYSWGTDRLSPPLIRKGGCTRIWVSVSLFQVHSSISAYLPSFWLCFGSLYSFLFIMSPGIDPRTRLEYVKPHQCPSESSHRRMRPPRRCPDAFYIFVVGVLVLSSVLGFSHVEIGLFAFAHIRRNF